VIAVARGEWSADLKDLGGRIEYWEAKGLQLTGKPLVFASAPQAFAFSPDGKTLITGHDRGGAQLWDVTTGSRVGSPLPHGGIVWGVAFSPDGTAILTGCGDGIVRIWDSRTGQPLCAVSRLPRTASRS
jgi:WD40 repeat protein